MPLAIVDGIIEESGFQASPAKYRAVAMARPQSDQGGRVSVQTLISQTETETLNSDPRPAVRSRVNPPIAKKPLGKVNSNGLGNKLNMLVPPKIAKKPAVPVKPVFRQNPGVLKRQNSREKVSDFPSPRRVPKTDNFCYEVVDLKEHKMLNTHEYNNARDVKKIAKVQKPPLPPPKPTKSKVERFWARRISQEDDVFLEEPKRSPSKDDEWVDDDDDDDDDDDGNNDNRHSGSISTSAIQQIRRYSQRRQAQGKRLSGGKSQDTHRSSVPKATVPKVITPPDEWDSSDSYDDVEVVEELSKRVLMDKDNCASTETVSDKMSQSSASENIKKDGSRKIINKRNLSIKVKPDGVNLRRKSFKRPVSPVRVSQGFKTSLVTSFGNIFGKKVNKTKTSTLPEYTKSEELKEVKLETQLSQRSSLSSLGSYVDPDEIESLNAGTKTVGSYESEEIFSDPNDYPLYLEIDSTTPYASSTAAGSNSSCQSDSDVSPSIVRKFDSSVSDDDQPPLAPPRNSSLLSDMNGQDNDNLTIPEGGLTSGQKSPKLPPRLSSNQESPKLPPRLSSNQESPKLPPKLSSNQESPKLPPKLSSNQESPKLPPKVSINQNSPQPPVRVPSASSDSSETAPTIPLHRGSTKFYVDIDSSANDNSPQLKPAQPMNEDTSETTEENRPVPKPRKQKKKNTGHYAKNLGVNHAIQRNQRKSRYVDRAPMFQNYEAEAKRRATQRMREIPEDEVMEETENEEKVPETEEEVEQTVKYRKGGTLDRALWSELPEVRKSGLLMTLDRQQLKLQETMFEVISSEASYLHSLNVFIDNFVQNIHILSSMEHRQLCSNIATIRDVSEKLLCELETRQEESLVLTDICDILEKYAQNYFHYYVVYCSHQSQQMRTYTELMKNGTFADLIHLLEHKPVCQGLSFQSFITLPMQRITRLPLLIENIFHRAVEDSQTYTSAKSAYIAVKKVVQECNEGARKMDRIYEMFEIQQQLKMSKQLALISENRWLVKRGDLIEIKYAKSKLPFSTSVKPVQDPIHLILFTDLLLITRRKSDGSFVVEDHCLRNMCQIQAIETPSQYPQFKHGVPEGCTNIFILVLLENYRRRQREFLLNSPKLSDRQRWIDVITPEQGDDDYEEGRIYEAWDCPQVQCVDAYTAEQPDELSLEESDIINVYRKLPDGWYEGERLRDGEKGWFPATHVEEILSQHVRAKNLRERYKLLCISQCYIHAKLGGK
ncbi:uncharacterized protein LOC144451340 [Glandiceps talaboti]